MANVILAAQVWLADQLRDHVSESATFEQDGVTLTVNVTQGAAIAFPYDDGEDPPRGMVYFLRVDELVDVGPIVPREGATLTLGGRTFELVPFGGAPPARLKGLHYECQFLETTGGKRRRDTLVDIVIPLADGEQNEFGEVSRTDGTKIADRIYVTVIAEGGSESTIGGKSVGQQNFRVLASAADIDDVWKIIPSRARVIVRTGWLAGKSLHVQSGTRQSVAGQEVTMLCRLGGLS